MPHHFLAGLGTEQFSLWLSDQEYEHLHCTTVESLQEVFFFFRFSQVESIWPLLVCFSYGEVAMQKVSMMYMACVQSCHLEPIC